MPEGNALHCIFDLFVPRECPACRTGFEGNTAHCVDCDQALQHLESAARCGLCSMPLTLPGAPCAQCLGNGLPPFDQIVCLGVMKEPLKQAIHRAKYDGRWTLAEQLADRLVARRDVRDLLEMAEVIVPVPLHRAKHFQRGYNQAEVIARRICQRFNRFQKRDPHQSAICADSLFDPPPSGWGYQRWLRIISPPTLKTVIAARRIRSTDTQTHMKSRASRVENLRDAFELTRPDVIDDKHVVLVDDVLTTGATLRSLARTLKKGNPRTISAIVLAVADPKGRAFEVI